MAAEARYLLITADDYGIGPETSRGILSLAQRGHITSAVLLANSPHSETAVQQWRSAGEPMELGWHPTLTLDRPILPAGAVSSLVDGDGAFFPLGTFLRRWILGRIRVDQIHAELVAQHRRCCELLNAVPLIVNMHHHLHVFHPVGAILRDILIRQTRRPYFRTVREPWSMLWQIRGSRLKRAVLNWFGRRQARRLHDVGFTGNQNLMGVTDSRGVQNPDFLIRWIRRVPGQIVELASHPGFHDPTLIGRDSNGHDGLLERREQEMTLLSDPRFAQAFRDVGFRLVAPSALHQPGDAQAA